MATNKHFSGFVSVEGARQHNLRNLTLEIPREKLVVITGMSGAGKSSLLAKYKEGMERAGEPVTWLATTSDAAGVLATDKALAKQGFAVNTVARFLLDSNSASHYIN